MNVIIHDLEEAVFQTSFEHIKADTLIISDNGKIRNCIGCFGCWVKSPGKCVIKDGYDNMGEILSKAQKIIIISQCCFGGYSPFVKNILDRSISYLSPFFKTRHNETHHRQRYKKDLSLSVYFYGENISPNEIKTAKNLVAANSRNFYVSDYKTSFYNSPNDFYEEKYNENQYY